MENAVSSGVATTCRCIRDGHSEEPDASVRKEELKMRSIPFVLAAFVLAAFAFSAPAVAQSWDEYSYPEYAISVAFPASPKIETATYQVADGRSVAARVYSVRQDNRRVQNDGR
jgi:hypothetical protein